MSLIGLHAPAVNDAMQFVNDVSAGWLLLHYSARDAVELLGWGRGGAYNTREAILQYRETSPLYGLINYRRRKVLIRYIPDGTPELLQGTC